MTEAESEDEHDGRTSGGPAAETDKGKGKEKEKSKVAKPVETVTGPAGRNSTGTKALSYAATPSAFSRVPKNEAEYCFSLGGGNRDGEAKGKDET